MEEWDREFQEEKRPGTSRGWEGLAEKVVVDAELVE